MNRRWWKARRMCPLAALAGAVVMMAAAHATDAPDRTTATYGSWELHCVAQADGAVPAGDACEMVQTIRMQGQTQPLARIAVGRPEPGGADVLVFQVPHGVWLPAGVRLETGDDETAVEAQYRRCDLSGCVAGVDIDDELIRRLTADAPTPPRMVFEIREAQPVAVTLSFHGFAAAYAALRERLD